MGSWDQPSWEHVLDPLGIRGEEAWEWIHLLPAVSGGGLLPQGPVSVLEKALKQGDAGTGCYRLKWKGPAPWQRLMTPSNYLLSHPPLTSSISCPSSEVMATAFSAQWLRGSSFCITYLGNGLIQGTGQGGSPGSLRRKGCGTPFLTSHKFTDEVLGGGGRSRRGWAPQKACLTCICRSDSF